MKNEQRPKQTLQPAESKSEDPQSGQGFNGWFDRVIAELNGWHATIGAIIALLTVVANLEGFLEKQWKLAAATLVTALMGTALLIVADRRQALRASLRGQIVRAGAFLVLIGTVPVAIVGLFCYALLPRLEADHVPTFAIARFDGPDLPKPYADCRPSDMLADSLNDVANRFHQLTAFELPYIVDPDGRWADLWARTHGWLQGADVVVYGEYSLVDHALGSDQPDRVLISPHVSAVPLVPLGWKRAPLLQWQFNPRLVPIDQLCSGTAARFIIDGRRLGLALSALRLFARHEFVGAQRALTEAEDVSNEIALEANASNGHGKTPAQMTSKCYGVSAQDSECSGVLAFYLAALEQRTGNYARAESAYKIATKKLDRAAPYINLAELYALQCDWKNVLLALNSAVWADPSSVAALATRSHYEYEYGERDQAHVDLERARSRPIQSVYDRIALGRALHQRPDAESKRAGIAELKTALRGGSTKLAMLDTQVELANWLLDDGKIDEAIGELRDAVATQPDNIKADYMLALAFAAKSASAEASPATIANDRRLMKQSYLQALSGRAFTDEEYTTQGNAAFGLGAMHQALSLYAQAIRINPNAVYALSGRGNVFERSGHYQLAVESYARAAKLHPNEAALQQQLFEARKLLALGP